MPERISRTDVAAIAKLARLVLTEAELALATEQLGDILDHAGDMAALDLSGVEPTSHPFPLSNVLRDDVALPSLAHEEVMAAAPSVEDGMFRVPPVMGDEP